MPGMGVDSSSNGEAYLKGVEFKMENEVSNNGNVQDTQESAVTEETTGGSASTESSDTSLESGAEATQSAEGSGEDSQTEFVKDFDGKEFVPKEAFQKRVDALTAKARKAEEALEAIRTNPEFRKQFLGEEEKAKSEAEPAPSEESPSAGNVDPTEFMKPINGWLSGLSQTPEVQSFYKNYTEAMYKTFEGAVKHFVKQEISNSLSKEVAPLRKAFDESSLSEFKKANPDYEKYRVATEANMKKFNVPRSQAFKLAKHDDLAKELASLKGGKSPVQTTTVQRQNLAKVPIAKRPAANSGEAEEAMDLHEAAAYAVRQAYRGRK